MMHGPQGAVGHQSLAPLLSSFGSHCTLVPSWAFRNQSILLHEHAKGDISSNMMPFVPSPVLQMTGHYHF